MFLFEKYRPKNIGDFRFNRDILVQLLFLAEQKNLPHLIITGPSGSGKKTLLQVFLGTLYGPSVYNVDNVKYNVAGASAKKSIQLVQSNHHIIVEPTGTNHDKHLLQNIIKQYVRYKPLVQSRCQFKTIVIYHLENLAVNSQAALRRTMEIYIRGCRFIMLCNNLSKIIEPLRSRCHVIRVPAPSKDNVFRTVFEIALRENLDPPAEIFSLPFKQAVWRLEKLRYGCPIRNILEDAYDQIVEFIFNDKHNTNFKMGEIKKWIYNILITNVKSSDVIISIMERIVRRVDDRKALCIIRLAARAEYRLIHGRRDAIHIDYFVLGAFQIIIL